YHHYVSAQGILGAEQGDPTHQTAHSCVLAQLLPPWRCTPRFEGFIDVIGPYDSIRLSGEGGLTVPAFVFPGLHHKHGWIKHPKRHQVMLAIIQIEPDIFASINEVHLTGKVMAHMDHRYGDLRYSVRRALKDLQTANRSPC